MIIDVWSDVVCPWCFIGKRRLEKALANIPLDVRSGIEVRHRAFQLQPDLQVTTPTSALLAQKYQLDIEQVHAMQANVCSIADGEGLCYELDNTLSGNTADAHRLLAWAKELGKEDILLEAMYSGYFEKSKPLFSHEDLLAIVSEAGLDIAAAKAILDSEKFADQVKADAQLAGQLGASGVPFFVVDMKYGISGAQPLEVFEATIAQALAEV
jgi:predicted DsbA family dithiol-disulfide isomerase